MTATRPRADRPQLRLPAAAVHAARGRREHARAYAAARAVLALLADFAARGQTPLAAALGAAQPTVWTRYAAPPQVRRGPGELFFYYHSHARTPPDEHGHFHLFAGCPGTRPDGTGRYVHLAGIGVDARGLPQRLFTTNRWVTDETWLPAPRVLALLAQVRAGPRPDAASTPVEAWLRALLDLFAPQLEHLLAHRDARIRARPRPRVLEDRRMHVLSACRVSLIARVAALEASTETTLPEEGHA